MLLEHITGTDNNQTDMEDLENSATVNTSPEEAIPLESTPLDNVTSDTEPSAIAVSQSSPQTASDTEPIVTADSQSSPQTTVEPTTTTETKKITDPSEVIAVADAPAVPEPTPETFIKKPILSRKLCGICTKKEAKYKCSRCSLPFCSVSCSIIHKASHPPLDPQPSLPPKPPVVETKSNPRPGTVAAAGHKGPFAALDESAELQELFKTYPRLPSLLEEIDKRTLPPTSNNQNGGLKGNFRRKEEPWNADVGLKKGIEALNQARNSSNKDGKSLREYSRLVLQILSGESEESASEQIQKEQAAENARIIERLLQGER